MNWKVWLGFTRETAIAYKELQLETALSIDIIVGQRVIVELKSVETLTPIHEPRLLPYLRMSGCRLGLLIDLNVLRLKDGTRRMIP